MATLLNKIIKRESTVKRDGRALLVSLTPDQTVLLRLKGQTKRNCEIPIGDLWDGLEVASADVAKVVDEARTVSTQPPAGYVSYRRSGRSLYIGEAGPWITTYGSGIYISEALRQGGRQ